MRRRPGGGCRRHREHVGCTVPLAQSPPHGYRLGNGELVDAVVRDGLWDIYNNLQQRACAAISSHHEGISRQEQDEFAVASFPAGNKGQKEKPFCRRTGGRGNQGPRGLRLRQRGREPGNLKRGKVAGVENHLQHPPAAAHSQQRLEHQRCRRRHRRHLSGKGKGPWREAAGQDPRLLDLLARARSGSPWHHMCNSGDSYRSCGLSVGTVELFEVNEAFSVRLDRCHEAVEDPARQAQCPRRRSRVGHPIAPAARGSSSRSCPP